MAETQAEGSGATRLEMRRLRREDKQLHVHHGHYEKGKEPWNYLPQDLHVLLRRVP